MWAGIFQALLALAPVIAQVLLLLLKAWFGDKTALDRAREVQAEVLKEAQLMKEGKDDELSRREKARIGVLNMLLRQRRVRDA